MRDISGNASRSRLHWTGAISFVIGLSLTLLVGEWFATFDACVANPLCGDAASPDTLADLLGLQVVGVALAVWGAGTLHLWRNDDEGATGGPRRRGGEDPGDA
jgi:hypothetical protein